MGVHQCFRIQIPIDRINREIAPCRGLFQGQIWVAADVEVAMAGTCHGFFTWNRDVEWVAPDLKDAKRFPDPMDFEEADQFLFKLLHRSTEHLNVEIFRICAHQCVPDRAPHEVGAPASRIDALQNLR
ncbi:MAG: hypothetical protein BWY82_01805 [Verrucomicrobia bacterium ADurb.Bin474]|nr:MAG: hypothetical protein BWY82_01805 [Verrucomicrobia bacterium ADurb.Bin474]